MVTLVYENRPTEINAEPGDSLWAGGADIEAATGWQLKPEGMCRGDTCVPVPSPQSDYVDGDLINLSAFWEYIGKPLARSRDGRTWSLGEDAGTRNDAMLSLEAPDFTLPDFEGNLHSLHDFRRQRVLLITWASW